MYIPFLMLYVSTRKEYELNLNCLVHLIISFHDTRLLCHFTYFTFQFLYYYIKQTYYGISKEFYIPKNEHHLNKI
ncbi:hypothetical protein Hdeb2414_s0018g00520111 [Helianthus debilis subsp. tardiflorus]